MGKKVPSLKRKFELLIHYGPYKTFDALAVKFDVSYSTMRGWWTGSWKADPNTLPEKHFPVLVDLFQELLTDAAHLVQAALLAEDIRVLENILLSANEIVLEDILAREARCDTGQLHRGGQLGLVRHRSTGRGGLPSVRLNELFHLEFETRSGGFLLVLQNAPQTWGVVKFADGKVTPQIKAGPIFIPGLKGKQYVDIYEADNVGIHRFVLFVSPNPFPPVITLAVQGGKSLDWHMLCELARHFDDQVQHRREVHLIEIDVVR